MIKVYTKNDCIQCTMLKKFLKANNVDFETLNVTDNPSLINKLKAQGIGSLPVFELNNEIKFTGFRPDLAKKLI